MVGYSTRVQTYHIPFLTAKLNDVGAAEQSSVVVSHHSIDFFSCAFFSSFFRLFFIE